MTSDTIEFVVRLRGGAESGAQAKKLASEVEALGGKVKRVGDESTRASHGTGLFGGSLKKLAIGLGAVGAGYAAWSAAKGAITYTTELAKSTRTLSAATGMSTGKTSNLIAVSNALGVESNKLGMLFVKLGKATTAQAEGTGKHVTAFDKLGISQAEAKAHMNDTAGMLDLVTHKLASEHIPAAEKAALMTELMGRGWMALGPLLLEGDTNFGKLTAKAKEYGLELGGKGADSLKKFHDQQVEAALASEGLKVSFTKLVAGPLGGLLSGFAKLTVYARKGEWANFQRDVDKMAHSFEVLAEKIMPHVAESFAHIAPNVLRAFWRGFINAPLGGQLVLAGLLATKFGMTGAIFGGIGGALAKGLKKGIVAKAPIFAEAGAITGAVFEVAFAAAVLAGAVYLGYKLGMMLRKALGLEKTEYVDPSGKPMSKGQIGAEERKNYANQKAQYERLNKTRAAHHLAPVPFTLSAPHAAMGGTLLTPGMVEVGERGPELVNLPSGAQVSPLKAGSLVDTRPIIIQVSGREIARVTRREALESQAAGA